MKSKKILLAKAFNRMSYGIVPPISLGYLAASLTKDGWDNIEIMDCVLHRITPEKFEEEVRKTMPDVLGMTVFSNNLSMVRRQMEIAKKINPKIVNIIGGPHPSSVPADELFAYFGDSADYAFRGEGDKGLPMLLDKIFDNKVIGYEEIPGLVWRENGVSRLNPTYMEENLDILPMPRWDMMPPDKYPQATMGSFFKNFPIAFLVTSRGCPFQCTFCASKPVVGRNIRFRSVENVMEEIRFVSKTYGIKEFHILDDNFTLNRERATEICRRVIAEKIPVTFYAVNGLRLDTLDRELLAIMKEAGFFAINIGIESGSQRILDHMKKNLKKELVREKANLISSMGFMVSGLFIVGYPAEKREDIEETIEFAKSLELDRATFSLYLPLPGSEMYNTLKENDELQGLDWDKVTFDSVSYVPNGMTSKELKGLQKKAFFSFFLRPKILYRLLKSVRSFEHFKFLFMRGLDYFVNVKSKKT